MKNSLGSSLVCKSVGVHLNPFVRVKRLTNQETQRHKKIKQALKGVQLEVDHVNKQLVPVVNRLRLNETSSTVKEQSEMVQQSVGNEVCLQPSIENEVCLQQSIEDEVCLELLGDEVSVPNTISNSNNNLSSSQSHKRWSENLEILDENANPPKEKDSGPEDRMDNEVIFTDEITDVQYSDGFSQDSGIFDEEFVRFDLGRMLTDEEVWDGLKGLNSGSVLVLPPSVCLNMRLMQGEDMTDIHPEIDASTQLILAPISNAQQDDVTGYNTEGSHWSLVVVDLSQQEYYHLDSIPKFNHYPALEFCENVNSLLRFKPFTFIEKECRQQCDSYSCGVEVMKNAREQVELLKRYTADMSALSDRYNYALSVFTGKPKLVLMGDNHALNIADLVRQLLPQFDVLSDQCQWAPTRVKVDILTAMSKFLRDTDCIVVISGTEEARQRDYARAALRVSELITTSITTDDDDLPFRFYVVRKNDKFQEDSDESVQDPMMDNSS